jgi:aspartyl-tRNA(Asn)/glutamyl-tRNA(Gln) amidotransferase subunit C
MIGRAEVEHIAELARLGLTEDEIASIAHQLTTVLDYVEQLKRVDTDGVEPTCFVVPEQEPLRDDVERESLPLQQALRNAPQMKKGYFAIPKVIGESRP